LGLGAGALLSEAGVLPQEGAAQRRRG